MLHWLAGQRPSENGFDVTTVTEGPETPAPVFAVRAFKHAIFGTPQTAQPPKPRRHSTAENTRPKACDAKLSRPAMIRPKSWHDAQGLDRDEDAVAMDPLPSPTKGILMTPGTAAARRKTVSFGDQVVDNKQKRLPKSGLPDGYPGKFPSPWSKPDSEFAIAGSEDDSAKPKSRNKLTEALNQARDESGKSKARSGKASKDAEDGRTNTEPPGLQSNSARYWKQEYDIYRENTTREVKKLVAKQKAAKNFARDKDVECAQLKEQLRQEQERASLLEKRTAELEAQLKEFQEKLQHSQADERRAKAELRQLELQDGPASSTRPTFAEQIDAARSERKERRTLVRPRSAFFKSASEVHESATQTTENPSENLKSGNTHPHVKNQLESTATTTTTTTHSLSKGILIHDEQWLPPISGSAVSSSSKTSKLPHKFESAPLKNLSVNTASQDTRSIALSMGLQPPSPVREARQDSPMHSPTQAPPDPHDPPIKASEQTLIEPRPSPADPSAQPLPSRPVASGTEPVQRQHHPRPTSPVAARAAARTAAAAMQPAETKENIAPMPEEAEGLPRADENLKPSAAWTGLTTGLAQTAAADAKRMVSKDGREVGADRIAAARARILARGRQVS